MAVINSIMMDRFDFVSVFRALDSCLQYGVDPFGWRMQLCCDLAEVLDSQVTLCGEFQSIWDDDRALVNLVVDHGWPSVEAQRHFVRYQVDGAHRRDPMRQALKARRGEIVVAACSALLDFDEYRESDVYQTYMRQAGVGDVLTAVIAIGEADADRWTLLTCMRASDGALFTDRERECLEFLAGELRGLVGGRLADAGSPIAGLTARERQTLDVLLTGATEAAAARQMGVRPGTFHGYVQSVYRRFGVSSRAELHGHFYGRGRLWDGGAAAKDPRRARLRRNAMPMTDSWPGRRTFL